MFKKISESLLAKLIFYFFIVGFLPLIVLAATTYYYANKTLESQVFAHIEAANETMKEQVTSFLRERLKVLIFQSRTQSTAVISDQNYYKIAETLFRDYMKIFGFTDIMVLDLSGNVMFSSALRQMPGTRMSTSDLADPTLNSLAASIIKKNEAVFTDIVYYAPMKRHVIFMGAPVIDEAGNLQSILVFEIDAGQITGLVKHDLRLGQTGEIYLIGQDGLLRSGSKFISYENILARKIETKASLMAIRGKSGKLKMIDYRGKRVLAVYAPMRLNDTLQADFDWGIVTKVDYDEAMSFLSNLRLNILWILLLLVVLVGVVGVLQSNAIAKPLQVIAYHTLLMDEGDFTADLPEKKDLRKDEIGILWQTFARGTKRFREQIRMIKESSEVLVGSITQISTTATQLASSASETSTSITEVTATVEEVRQTSQMALEKAENVSRSAERTAKISQAGKAATENTMAGISRIKKEMNYIAESTVKLSEQMQRIGEIINTVTDIADQSNILAVNAAIEAAKAGEHGKGFAVVAQEVKSLAEQSKDATSQVRSILNDIQKATSAAVMATERGIKTVDEAVELSEQAGIAIDRLTHNVSESSAMALQITASTQQQLTGIDQLSTAMESISEATRQNLESVKQLEEAIKDLETMGHKLKEFISTYKV